METPLLDLIHKGKSEFEQMGCQATKVTLNPCKKEELKAEINSSKESWIIVDFEKFELFGLKVIFDENNLVDNITIN